MERVIANASREDVLKSCDDVLQSGRWKYSNWIVSKGWYCRTVSR
jgi:hypothetical protein